jgi:hypothetical protein
MSRSSYTTLRKVGGLKGLGTGARSARKGASTVRTVVTQLTKPPPPPLPYTRRRLFRNYSNMTPEIKTIDHTFEAALAANPYVPDLLTKTVMSLNSTGALQALMIQQGVGTNQRVGNSVALKSLRLRFRIQALGLAVPTNTMIRVLLIYDRQPNGVYPATNTILANINEAGTISAFDPDGDLNVNQMDRYIILMDEWHQVPGSDLNGTSDQIVMGPFDKECYCIDRFIKLRGLEQRYSGTASPMTISLQTTGALYLLTTGNVAANQEPYQLHGKVRLRYYDH